MKEFFNILFKKSKPQENGFFSINTDDIIDGFTESGFYKYDDCCGVTHLQKKPFTKRQIKKIEKEAKNILDLHVQELTEHINKEILKEMENKGLIPSVSSI